MKLIRTQSYETAANTYGDENNSRIAILMPGRLDTKDYINFTSHGKYLAEKGFFVLAIDPPGTWDSPGELSNYTTSNYLKAVNELISHYGNKPTLLLGHSRGGATAMLASANPTVKALVVINSAYGAPTPPSPNGLVNGVLPEIRDLPPGDVRSKEQVHFDLPKIYFEDGRRHNPLGALMNFKGPKLVVHASRDEFMELSKVIEIYEGLSEPKMFFEINCNHDYRLYPEVIHSVNNALGQFIDKYLSKSN